MFLTKSDVELENNSRKGAKTLRKKIYDIVYVINIIKKIENNY